MRIIKKVLLVATVQSHICQFHKPLVEMLHENNCEVHVAARNNLAEKNGLKLDFVEHVFDAPFQRSPFSTKNLKAYYQLRQIIREGNYDVIHCNTPVGGVLGRLAARQARKKGSRVFYTAHGFHFYKGAPLSNWLIWYPVEKFMSRFCDTLITITKEDYELAKARFACKVAHVHGVGVYSERFHPVTIEERIQRRVPEALTGDDYVILCVGELNKNKNQNTLISAAALIKESIPHLQILLAGNGPRESEYRQQIEELGLTEHVRMIGYRTDLEHITPAVDLVVSCSHREGLPLNIVEAMLCSKPVIASNNRGHRELVMNGQNGFLVDADDTSAYADSIIRLFHDKSLASSMGACGLKLAQIYAASMVTKEYKSIYGL